ncbi:hypothetical protein [Armatimonas sp.]|uniref:hypothetical protein n=1 Tax=Armatimonas sp. TaxID=1872638 RepID=UPI00286CB571|nr:hypothetical protein [Armatimonas sp.]
MPEWVDDQKEYTFKLSSELRNELRAGPEVKTNLLGVMDASENERAKIVIGNHADNKNISVLEPKVLGECIKSISNSAGIDPIDVDWYARNNNGELKSLSLEIYSEKSPNLEYQRLVNNHEFADHTEAERAKKAFPDIDVQKIRVNSFDDPTPEQGGNLHAAFDEAYLNRENHVEQEKNNQNIDKSPHEYDISQESFSR